MEPCETNNSNHNPFGHNTQEFVTGIEITRTRMIYSTSFQFDHMVKTVLNPLGSVYLFSLRTTHLQVHPHMSNFENSKVELHILFVLSTSVKFCILSMLLLFCFIKLCFVYRFKVTLKKIFDHHTSS